jgi:hypothetical protein
MAKIKARTSSSHKTKPTAVTKQAFERVYWPYIPIVIAITLLLSLGNMGGALKAAVHHPLGNVLSYSTSMSIGGLLSATNTQRNVNSVASLGLNGQLNAAAQAKADDMAARNYWSHNTPEGYQPWIFVDAQGYSYQKLGENLATGFADEQSTINGWMASPAHRDNLLDSAFSEVGFGYANNPNYTAAGGGPMTIVVAMYGKPVVAAAPVAAAPPAAPSPSNSVQSANTQAAAPADQPATPAAASADDTAKPSEAKQAATTQTPAAKLTAPVKTSHLQLAAPGNSFGSAATKLSIVLAAVIVLLWSNRHIRALHKFFVKGERYALRHPLSDLGVLTIAALLFIISHTAGLIQ